MMIAPDRIWHEVVTTNNMAELSVFGTRPDDWNSENFIEYARVTPDTITLPRAEVEALMEAARAAWDEACANHEKAPPIKYLAPYGGLVRLHTALAALQERMK